MRNGVLFATMRHAFYKRSWSPIEMMATTIRARTVCLHPIRLRPFSSRALSLYSKALSRHKRKRSPSSERPLQQQPSPPCSMTWLFNGSSSHNIIKDLWLVRELFTSGGCLHNFGANTNWWHTWRWRLPRRRLSGWRRTPLLAATESGHSQTSHNHQT